MNKETATDLSLDDLRKTIEREIRYQQNGIRLAKQQTPPQEPLYTECVRAKALLQVLLSKVKKTIKIRS